MTTPETTNWVDAHAEAYELVMAGLAQSNSELVLVSLAAQESPALPNDLSETEPPQTPAQARALMRLRNRQRRIWGD